MGGIDPRIHVFTVAYEDEVETFRKLALKLGAVVEAVTKIPHRNYLNEPVGWGNWAIIYYSDKPIEMEVKT